MIYRDTIRGARQYISFIVVKLFNFIFLEHSAVDMLLFVDV